MQRQNKSHLRQHGADCKKQRAEDPDRQRYEDIRWVPDFIARRSAWTEAWRLDSNSKESEADIPAEVWLGYLKQIKTATLLCWLSWSRHFAGWYDVLGSGNGRGYDQKELKAELALRPHVPRHVKKHAVIKTDSSRGLRVFFDATRSSCP